MLKPIPDRAEVAVDFPDKTYMGAFGPRAKFETRVDNTQVLLKLVRDGEERRSVEMHLHLELLAAMLADMADGFRDLRNLDDLHRESLIAAAARLSNSLARR